VIEVNIQPAQSWREAVDITFGLYEDAGKVRFSAQSLSGRRPPHRHRRGNHVVVGGSSPQDSPFLRRPDLLKSLVLYWQRHPSLSYFFSGMFIGPTSQAPRIDEARHDRHLELESRARRMCRRRATGAAVAGRPLFRHILGRHHRQHPSRRDLHRQALFADGPTGRSASSNSARSKCRRSAHVAGAAALIRALIAKFWREPQQGKFVRWGTALHDRFMLPHFIWEDFQDVLSSSRAPAIDSSRNGIWPSSNSASRLSAASIKAA
jgi:uncharacterized protein (DUF2126 family)